MEGDLKVEHMNLRFKAGLMQLCGNYTEDALQRVAKSLDVRKSLLEKLTPYYTERYNLMFIHFMQLIWNFAWQFKGFCISVYSGRSEHLCIEALENLAT